MLINKQLDMNDLKKNKEVQDLINKISKLDPDYFSKVHECRLWEYGWLLYHAFKILKGAPRSMRWLDVGSGDSIVPFFLASQGIEVYVTEISDAFRDRFENNKFNLPINFHVLKDYKIPFSDNFFDVVSSISVVEHIPDGQDSASIVDCARALKPGGLFVLTTDVAKQANYSNSISAGRNGELHWHWYDLPGLNSKIVDVAQANKLSMFGNTLTDIDFNIKVPHMMGVDYTIVSLFFKKQEEEGV